MGVLFVLRSTWHKWFCFSGLKLRETPQPMVLARGVVSFITSTLAVCCLLSCVLLGLMATNSLSSAGASLSDSVSADLSQPGNVISVKCGSVEGSLYLDRLLGGQPRREVVSCPPRARLPARNGLVNEVKFLGLIHQNGGRPMRLRDR